MKKTKLTRSLLAACSIVALTTVMYGCVHGGGDDEPAMDPPPVDGGDGDGDGDGDMMPGPDPEPTACESAGASQACVDQRTAELTAAETALAALEASDAATQGEIRAAEMTVSEATMALNTATQLNEADVAVVAAEEAVAALTAMSTDADVEDARTSVTAAQELVDALEDGGDMATRLATADTDLSVFEMGIADRIAGEKVVAATAAAKTKTTAITAEADQPTDAGLGGSAVTATDNSEGAYNVVIEYGSTGIRVEGATDDDDEMFMMNDMGMLVREKDADADGNIVRKSRSSAPTSRRPWPRRSRCGKAVWMEPRLKSWTPATSMRTWMPMATAPTLTTGQHSLSRTLLRLASWLCCLVL